MSVESINGTSEIASIQSAASQQVQQQEPVVANDREVQPAPEQAQDVPEMTAEEMQAVADKLNEFMQNGQRNLNFSVDKDTDEMVIKVMDTETQEVIRQFPSEEALKLTKHIEGMMGLIFNDHA